MFSFFNSLFSLFFPFTLFCLPLCFCLVLLLPFVLDLACLFNCFLLFFLLCECCVVGTVCLVWFWLFVLGVICFLLFSFCFLWLQCVACGLLVHWSGFKLRPPEWECRILDAGPPENSWPQRIVIGMHSPGGIRLNAKLPSGSNAGYAKQLARQEHSPTYQQTGCLSCTKLTDTPKHTIWYGLAHQGEKNSALPTRAQASVPPPRRPAQAPGPASFIRGQTAEAKGTVTQHSKVDKIKWQGNMLQAKEQDKIPVDKINSKRK